MMKHALLREPQPARAPRSVERDGGPKYRRLHETLRSKILSGEFPPGGQIPTEEKLCARYRASRGTVRHALALLVQEGLLYRVSGQGTFVSDPTRHRVGVRGAKHFLTLVVSQLNEHFSVQSIRGVQKFLHDTGYHLVMDASDNDCLREKDVLERVAKKVDGLTIVLTENGEDHSHILQLKSTGKPVVLLYRDIPDADIDYVGFDIFRGAIRLVDHLVGHGHKNICHVTSNCQHLSPVRDKLRGYSAGLTRHEIPYREEYVIKTDISFDVAERDPLLIERSCKTIMENFVNLSPRPTAIFAVNHKLAYWLGRCMIDNGVKVPEDVAMASFGDDEYLPDCPFGLTMMRHHIRRAGGRAARRLLELVADPNSPPERILISDDLVIRESCGPH